MFAIKNSPDTIYLYTEPFVKNIYKDEMHLYVKDYFDDYDRQDEEKIRALLLKFAIDEKLVTLKDDKILPSLTDNMGSWEWAINWLNFRSLVDAIVYHKFILTINSNNSYAITKIINLYTQLGMLFDEKLLNTLSHRTIKSASLIPYDVSKSPEITSWNKIHKETPFIWLIIYLQTIIHGSL